LFLRNASEVAAVRALTSAVDALFAELGTEQPDEAYLLAPGWSQVMSRAKELVMLLDREGMGQDQRRIVRGEEGQ